MPRLLRPWTLVRLVIAWAVVAFLYHSVFAHALPALVQKPLVQPSVPTKHGTFLGTTWTKQAHEQQVDIEAFLGIRYGQAPVGDARFRPARMVPESKETMLATRYGPRCPSPGGDWNEDCLFLNIFRRKVSSDKKLPVAVYFHGGSFHVGEGRVHDSASMLAHSEEPFIIVNFNYRLSAFGFLSSSAVKDDGPLNVGLRDQILLLQWVQENIEAFGGDPNQVTLFGVSAGAHSIGHLLMYTNDSTPLFHRAILEDGATTARSVLPYDSSLTEKQFKEFLVESHCDVADEKVMQCLREQDSEVLLSASNAVYDRYNPSNRWAFQPVIDGDIIPMQPIKAWEEGHWQRMPVMTGFTTDEGTPFAPKGMSNGKEFRNYMKALIPQMTRRHLKEMQNLYPDPLTTRSSPYKDTRALSTLGLGSQYKRISAAYGEWAYICPVRETAQFAHKTSNEPVFLYHFAVNTSVIHGAAHGEATAYETFSPSPWAQCDHSHDEEKCKKNQMAIAQHFHDYICSFILTGDPNKAESRSKLKPIWETYAPGKDNNIMLFGNGSDELAGGNSYGTPAEMSANDWPRINCGFWHKMRPLSES